MTVAAPAPRRLNEFKALDSSEAVAAFFNTTWQRLSYLLYSRRRPAYRIFAIPKKAGGYREIASPPPVIAGFQRQLLSCLTAIASPTSSSAHGFTPGCSVRTNAGRHEGARMLLNIDFVDFFSAIHFGRVRGVFKVPPFEFPSNVAAILAQVCCYRGRLPQGAPTSPILTNLACRGLDRDLRRLAAKCSSRYTRYADDITFSARRTPFDSRIVASGHTAAIGARVGMDLERIVSGRDFAINSAKTRVRTARDRLLVTGIVVNEKCNLPRRFTRHIRALLHSVERDGSAAADAVFRASLGGGSSGVAPSVIDHVKGKISYLGMVRGADDPLYVSLAIRATRLSKTPSTPVAVYGRAGRETSLLEPAFWVVRGRNARGTPVVYGTAFCLQGYGFVSAAHVFNPRPAAGVVVESWEILRSDHTGSAVPVTAVIAFADLDLAILVADPAAHARLRRAPTPIARGDAVRVVGFSGWVTPADSILDAPAAVSQVKEIGHVRYILTTATYREGMSGGAILNRESEVVGVALYDANAAAAPSGGVDISHIDELRGGIRRAL